MKRTRAGFTLIELLVVIAILALLVSILLPSLQKARDLARGAVCMSNLKQLGFVYQLYLEDNGQFNLYYKTGPAGTALAAMVNTWCDPTYSLLYQGGYLNYGSGADGKKSGLLDCPNVPEEAGRYFDQTNYLYNKCIFDFTKSSGAVNKPWTRVMFLDCLGDYFTADYNNMPDAMAGPHNESPNLLFYDGHVELRLEFYKGIARPDPEYAQAGGFISWFLPTGLFD